jgi:hypothetical protein
VEDDGNAGFHYVVLSLVLSPRRSGRTRISAAIKN